MNSSVLCSLLFTLGLILISHSPLAATARPQGRGAGLVDQICKETTTENKANCMAILNAVPKIARAKNYVELSKGVLELAVKKGIEAQNFLKGLAAKNNAKAIVDCANFHYGGVVGSFRSAMEELKDDPLTANYDAKVAGDGPDGCERGLVAANIVNPAISAFNRQILLLSNIAFLATNKLG